VSPFPGKSSAQTKGIATASILLLGICASTIVGCARAPSRRQPDTSARESIRRIAQSLPGDSHMRRRLDAGELGTGIHHPWMDGMRREGVKLAVAETEFVSVGRPLQARILRIAYFSDYDGDCSQIADAGRLSEILRSGLDSDLRAAAIQGTMEAPWFRLHRILPPLHGRGHIQLLDDEWLPPHSLLADVPERNQDPLEKAISLGDISDVRARLRRGVEATLRNGALWPALAGDESCTVGALLESGVDPNLRDRDGFTALMSATRLGAIRSAKTLLEAGADPNETSSLGRTALSLALGNQDMARLLKSHGAHE
jgi:hypothetical protein